MMKKTLAMSVAVALLSMGLTACGGSSSAPEPTPSPTPDPEPPAPIVPEINSARAIPGSLEQPGATSFERYLKNGIYSISGNNPIENEVTAPAPVTDDASEALGSDGGFSETNTSEVGVDEADRVEYDGDTLYVATQPIWNGFERPASAVRVLQRNEDFSLTEINSLEVGSQNGNVNGMYLYQDSLSVVSSDYPIMPLLEIASASLLDSEGTVTNTVDLQVFDTSTPAEASIVGDISIDGWLVASRRIDNYIYIVSAYSPYVELPHAFPETDEQRVENYEYLQSLDMAELMPTISVNEASSNMNQPEDCFIPEEATDSDGYSQLLTVTKINVQQLDDISSVCLSAYAETSYMSTSSLFLTAYSENGTGLHKIDISDSFSYAASGEVRGRVWNTLRMSESDGYFRIVTTDWSFTNEEGPEHRLFVLEQNGNELQTVAQLPNEDLPAKIGKPNEDIFAVRFIRDKAYIVTFERTDPLYVIDLTDNTSPFIAGELEIPGFSSYLHPMENGYLLGVGQEVEQQLIPGTGEEPVTFPVTTGVKVSLFDVSDPTNPQELSNVSFDDTYTPVEYDYRALSVLKTGEQYQFAMPLEAWVEESVPAGLDEEEEGGEGSEGEGGEGSEGEGGETGDEEPNPGFTVWTQQNSLLMLNVDATSGVGEMSVANQMLIDNGDEWYSWSGDDRSVIHGENVFFIHGNQVWQSQWLRDAAINGPY